MKYFAEKCMQPHNEAEKRKALGHPGIDPNNSEKKKKKSATGRTEEVRQEAATIVFPASMTASKPMVPIAASEPKKTRGDEAEARKCKHKNATEDAP